MIVYTNSSKSGMAINTNTPTSISFNGKHTTQMAHKSVMMEVEELVTMVNKDVRTSIERHKTASDPEGSSNVPAN